MARREAGRPIATTGDLAALVAAAIPRKSRADGAQHPATRTFQAVRIHVNQELEELALALEQAARALVERRSPRGHLVPFARRQHRQAFSRRACSSGARRRRRATPAIARRSAAAAAAGARRPCPRRSTPRSLSIRVRARPSCASLSAPSTPWPRANRMISRGFVVLAVLLLFGCALALVTAQHRTRSLFVDLERASRTRDNWTSTMSALTIELARLSQPAAVERAAVRLGFRAADRRPDRVPQPAATDRDDAGRAGAAQVKPDARSRPTIRDSRRSDSGARGERVGFNSNPLLTVALPAWRSKLLLFMLFVGFVGARRARLLPDGRCVDRASCSARARPATRAR